MTYDVEVPVYLAVRVTAPTEQEAKVLAQRMAREIAGQRPGSISYRTGAATATGVGMVLLDAGEDDEPDVYPVVDDGRGVLLLGRALRP